MNLRWRGLMMNEHVRATLAQSFKADIHKFSRDTRSLKRCNDFVNIPIHWTDSSSVKVKLTAEQGQREQYKVKLRSFFNLGTARGGWWKLYPRERSSTHCTEGWVGPRNGPNGCGKSSPPPGDSIAGCKSIVSINKAYNFYVCEINVPACVPTHSSLIPLSESSYLIRSEINASNTGRPRYKADTGMRPASSNRLPTPDQLNIVM